MQNENGKLRAALVSNLKSAVTAAFLMLPESFSEEDLFVQIAGLSYAGQFQVGALIVYLCMHLVEGLSAYKLICIILSALSLARAVKCDFVVPGDFRMVIGEDKSKVLNIVKANLPHFQMLYSNILQDCPQAVYKQHQGKLEVGFVLLVISMCCMFLFISIHPCFYPCVLLGLHVSFSRYHS